MYCRRARKVELTKPGSANRYRIEYPGGAEKWVDHFPGDKGDSEKDRDWDERLRRPVTLDFFRKLEGVVNRYLDGDAGKSDVEGIVGDYSLSVGVDEAKMVLRRLRRSESVKREKADDRERVDYYDVILDVLDIANECMDKKTREGAMMRVAVLGRYDASDIAYMAGEHSGRMLLTGRVLGEVSKMVERGDIDGAWGLASRHQSKYGNIPLDIYNWLMEHSKKKPVTEAWRSGVARDMEKLVGGRWVGEAGFLVNTEGKSNKFHYFGIFGVDRVGGEVEYVAANAYGGIGGKGKVVEIYRGSSMHSAMSAMNGKMRQKEGRGYERL